MYCHSGTNEHTNQYIFFLLFQNPYRKKMTSSFENGTKKRLHLARKHFLTRKSYFLQEKKDNIWNKICSSKNVVWIGHYNDFVNDKPSYLFPHQINLELSEIMRSFCGWDFGCIVTLSSGHDVGDYQVGAPGFISCFSNRVYFIQSRVRIYSYLQILYTFGLDVCPPPSRTLFSCDDHIIFLQSIKPRCVLILIYLANPK